MDFSKFEASFVKKNRLLWGILAISLLLSSFTLFFVVSSNKYFIVSNGKLFKERLLIEDVCLEAFTSMAQGSPSKYLISKGILDILENDPFLIPIDSVLKVSRTEDLKCKLLIRSEKRLRAFVLGLISDDDYPFFYKLNQLDEIAVKED